MPCRYPVVLALGLLALSGCQLPSMRLALGTSKAGTTGNKGETAHRPETYVSFGDMRARAASQPETSAAQAQQLKEEARLAYQQALVVDPNYAPAHRALARLFDAMEDYPHALASYQKALELNDKDAACWYEVGLCQARQKDWNGALGSFQRAVELDPDNRQYANTLGFLLARLNRHQEALEVFTRVNGPAKAHYNLARALAHVGQIDLAREHLRLAMTLDPKLPVDQKWLAEITGAAPAGQAIQTVGYSPAPTDPGPGQAIASAPPAPVRAIPVPPLPIISIHTRPISQ
jgi:tetratricopeptide (TPR) repeat protein